MLLWLTQHKDSINLLSGVATAIGTVGAVVVALWLAYQGNKLKLYPSALVGVIMPAYEKFLWLTCVLESPIFPSIENQSQQAIADL